MVFLLTELSVLRQVLPPLVTAYVVFVAMVVLARRRTVPRPRGRSERSSSVRLSRVVWTTVGGYVAFLVIVLIFHVWLAGETDALTSAVWSGAFLSGMTVVAAWAFR
jgi:TRAP-type C4-dicarboxylate transport system permease large subunit